MSRALTITLDDDVYDGLQRTVAGKDVSQFIEDLVRPHVLGVSLDDGYRALAEDAQREADALEWCNSLSRDMVNEAR
jgi:hypothetical protein